MRCIVPFFLLISSLAYSQEKAAKPQSDYEEIVVVGQRIESPTTPYIAMPSAFSGGSSGGTPGSGNPGFGLGGGDNGIATAVANENDKTSINERNTAKAKKATWVDRISKLLGSTVAETLSEFAKLLNFQGDFQWSSQRKVEIFGPNQERMTITECSSMSLDVGRESKNPCTEVRVRPVDLQMNNGSIEHHYVIGITDVDACFIAVENAYVCRPSNVFTFVVKDDDELRSLIDELRSK